MLIKTLNSYLERKETSMMNPAFCGESA